MNELIAFLAFVADGGDPDFVLAVERALGVVFT